MNLIFTFKFKQTKTNKKIKFEDFKFSLDTIKDKIIDDKVLKRYIEFEWDGGNTARFDLYEYCFEDTYWGEIKTNDHYTNYSVVVSYDEKTNEIRFNVFDIFNRIGCYDSETLNVCNMLIETFENQFIVYDRKYFN